MSWLNGKRYGINSRYIGDSDTRDQVELVAPVSRMITHGYDSQMRLDSLRDLAGGYHYPRLQR